MSKETFGFGQVTDVSIIRAASKGSSQAQHVIFERYKTAVLRTLIGMCHDRELARDLAQEVFIQAFRKLHQLKNPQRLGAWLKQLTVRTALSYFRSQTPPPEPLDDNIATLPSWSDQVDWLIQLRDINTLIKQLTEAERYSVWLYLGEGYSHEEIAQLTGEAAATVRKRYQRALAKLQAHITQSQEQL